MIDTAFSYRIGVAAGLETDAIEELSRLVDTIRDGLDDQERTDFAIELMDCVRRADGMLQLNQALHDWGFTTRLRQHPDYAWQKKEFENMQASGELMIGAEQAASFIS